jgi:hypothetical protein
MRHRTTPRITVLLLFFGFSAIFGFADGSDYIIRVSYDGPVKLHQVDVFLYERKLPPDADRSCQNLIPDPLDPPSEDTPWGSLAILPDTEGNIPERPLRTPTDVVFHYAVARATASDGAGGQTDYYATFGCTDQIPDPDPAAASIIAIDMHDLWPEIAGSYTVSSSGLTLRPIPNEFVAVRRAIDEFLYEPGIALLRAMAVAISGDQYWKSPLWNELFTCKGAFREPYSDYCKKVAPTKLGKLAGSIIEAHVDENLNELWGVQDASIRDELAQGEQIIELADSFSLSGYLGILQDPDPDGYLGHANWVIFTVVTWSWGGNDRSIDLRSEDYVTAENIEASLCFHPHDGASDVYSLDMSTPAVLSLNYPKMLFWVLEGVVFPELLGTEIVSFRDFAVNLMDCESLARRLLCEEPYGSDPDCNPEVGYSVNGIVAGCEVLQGGNPEPISPLVSSLLAGRETWHVMQTPLHNPCRMSLHPLGEFRIGFLGGDPVDPCEWEGEIVLQPEEVFESFNWTWWGEKH